MVAWSCGRDGYVCVLDASSGARLASAEHGRGEVYGVSFSPDGGRVASCGSYGYVRVFDASSGARLALAEHGGGGLSTASRSTVSRSRRTVVAWRRAATTGTCACSTRRRASFSRRRHGSGRVNGVSFPPDGGRGRRAATTGTRVFDASSGARLASAVHGGDGLRCLVLAGRWSRGVVRLGRVRVRVGRVVGRAAGVGRARRPLGLGVSFSPDGGRVASRGSDGYVRVFDVSSGARPASAEHGGGSVYGVSFAGRWSRGVVRPRRVRVRRVVGRAAGVAEHGGGGVIGVSFSSDGSRVASWPRRYVRVRRVVGRLASAEHGGGIVWGVSFSLDGRVASCGDDGYVRV